MIGVGTEAIHDHHLGGELPFHAEDAHVRSSLHQAPTQGVLRLEAHHDHRVLGVLHGGTQVMQHAASFAHPRRGDDHAWVGVAIDGDRFLFGSNVGQTWKLEGRSAAADGGAQLGVVALGMQRKDLGDVRGQR